MELHNLESVYDDYDVSLGTHYEQGTFKTGAFEQCNSDIGLETSNIPIFIWCHDKISFVRPTK